LLKHSQLISDTHYTVCVVMSLVKTQSIDQWHSLHCLCSDVTC